MRSTTQEIEQLFESFNQLNVLIVGDVMIDAYIWGSVSRISPEAPVPIVSVENKELRLGGAANVALNIQAMGATPILCSVVGDDEDGKEFIQLLDTHQQTAKGILRSSERRTTKKTRIIGNNHQMLRIDGEDLHELSKQEEENFLSKITSLIDTNSVDVIIFEDYDKGNITANLIQEIIQLAKKKGIPTAVDPKKEHFSDYKGVDLFKPNLKELKEGLKIEFDHRQLDKLEEAIAELEGILENKKTLITLSEFGVYINSKESKHHIKAHHRDIADVSGAGDTVISIASLCLAAKQPNKVIAELSNLAGGLVCENVGVVSINKEELKKEALKLFV